MGWGVLYEVESSARGELSGCTSKSSWYEALNKLNIETSPQLNAEDSIRFWASQLLELGHPAAKFFEGDLHAAYDEYDDPNVCFIGPDLARFFLEQLDMLGKQFFINLFPHHGSLGVGESWLYEPLRGFLRPLCEEVTP